MKIARLVIYGVIIFIFIGCKNEDVCRDQEMARKTSPDRIVDAIITKADCGATTSYSYRIFVAAAEGKPHGDSVFLADKVKDLNISWMSSRNLLITYTEARIFEFTNFWQTKEIKNFQYTVSIVEKKINNSGSE